MATVGAFAGRSWSFNPWARHSQVEDGTVATWGHELAGGDSSEVRDRLRQVNLLHATESAFAAALADGSLVTWGDDGRCIFRG